MFSQDNRQSSQSTTEEADQSEPRDPIVQLRHTYEIKDDHGDVVATLTLMRRHGALLLMDFAVHPDHREHGFGSALLMSAIADFGQNEDLYIQALASGNMPLDDDELVTFYEKWGFYLLGPMGMMVREAGSLSLLDASAVQAA